MHREKQQQIENILRCQERNIPDYVNPSLQERDTMKTTCPNKEETYHYEKLKGFGQDCQSILSDAQETERQLRQRLDGLHMDIGVAGPKPDSKNGLSAKSNTQLLETSSSNTDSRLHYEPESTLIRRGDCVEALKKVKTDWEECTRQGHKVHNSISEVLYNHDRLQEKLMGERHVLKREVSVEEDLDYVSLQGTISGNQSRIGDNPIEKRDYPHKDALIEECDHVQGFYRDLYQKHFQNYIEYSRAFAARGWRLERWIKNEAKAWSSSQAAATATAKPTITTIVQTVLREIISERTETTTVTVTASATEAKVAKSEVPESTASLSLGATTNTVTVKDKETPRETVLVTPAALKSTPTSFLPTPISSTSHAVAITRVTTLPASTLTSESTSQANPASTPPTSLAVMSLTTAHLPASTFITTIDTEVFTLSVSAT